MSPASARIGAGFLALVAVWIGVYWLWEPTGSPHVSFAEEDRPPARAEPDPQPLDKPVEPAPEPQPVPVPAPTETSTDVDTQGTDEPAPPVPPFRDYTIRDGDTFERISRRFFGTTRYTDAIAAANPFVSPTSLQVGQTIRIPNDPDNVQGRPEAGEESDLPNPEFTEYAVVKGDTLSGIAQRFYGSLRYADVIFNANRDTMRSEDDLQIGQILRIPSRANVLGEDGEP